MCQLLTKKNKTKKTKKTYKVYYGNTVKYPAEEALEYKSKILGAHTLLKILPTKLTYVQAIYRTKMLDLHSYTDSFDHSFRLGADNKPLESRLTPSYTQPHNLT